MKNETRVVKLFKNGASQAVRLPAEFRFEGDEIYATRDEQTGDLILSAHTGVQVWDDFFTLMHSIHVPQEFMDDRPLNIPPQERPLWHEK